jgi:hypothetical protein
MGAWGIGIFEDDDGYEHLDELLAAEDLVTALAEHLDDVLGSPGYLDYGQAFDALVPAAIVDTYVNGTEHEGLDELPPRPAGIEKLRPSAAKAVERVLGPNVELHELWAENDEYPAWKAMLKALAARLHAPT